MERLGKETLSGGFNELQLDAVQQATRNVDFAGLDPVSALQPQRNPGDFRKRGERGVDVGDHDSEMAECDRNHVLGLQEPLSLV